MNVAQWLQYFVTSILTPALVRRQAISGVPCYGEFLVRRQDAGWEPASRMRSGPTMRIAFVGLILLGVAVWLAWTLKTHGFSAREKPTRFEAFLARNARSLATPTDAKKMRNPLSPAPLDIAEGRDHFADHCAICHANNGSGKTEMGSNMYPPAPDMRERETQELLDGELFYIIRNGIRFTGMPGWG